ncbi:hypothetical protein GQ457_12G024440 [Hibiscus cannabinus]
MDYPPPPPPPTADHQGLPSGPHEPYLGPPPPYEPTGVDHPNYHHQHDHGDPPLPPLPAYAPQSPAPPAPQEQGCCQQQQQKQKQRSSTMAEQTEKAFLKQPKVFLSSKKSAKGKRPGKGGNRYWKSIGLGFKTPREAIEGTYIDKKCPFTGTVSVRGRILAGTCHSAKMIRTIIVRRNYLHFIKKYQRYEKRHSNIPAHISPCFRVKEGDHVIIGQCRPLSKTVRFNVLKVIPAGSSGGGKKAFTGM